MCGIIGYVGHDNSAKRVLIDSLKRLEYRGYDSAGISIYDGNTLNTIKSVGHIVELEKKIGDMSDGNIGIGHTRWATHGVVSEANSHPHTSGHITLVHNGIIENYAELKEKMIDYGVSFSSDTDSEVAASLLDRLYTKHKDILPAILEFKKKVKGSYAIAFLLDDDYEHIYCIKNLSPLVAGLADGESYIASDMGAILEYTNKYFVLEDGDFVILGKDDYALYDSEGKIKDATLKTYSGTDACIDKGDFEHFMLKEIYDEPEVIKCLLSEYVTDKGQVNLPDLSKYNRVTIIACGSAYHAGLIGKYLIENNLNKQADVEVASEFKYKRLFLNSDDVVIAISQSGETADTLAAVKIAKSLGVHTIGIVNVVESSIAREVDEVIYTHAGNEIAVATTKAYLAQSFVLFLLAHFKGFKKDEQKSLSRLPLLTERLVNNRKIYENIAQEIYKYDDVFFIGRLIDYAICLEGSLKLKEISYIHSEAYPAGELKHGTISLISDGTPVIAVISEAKIAEKTISNIKEVKARGAWVLLIVSEECNVIGDFYDKKIVIPCVSEGLSSLLSSIPLQLIAYEVAKMRECSIDKPRNLAKSVTVE